MMILWLSMLMKSTSQLVDSTIYIYSSTRCPRRLYRGICLRRTEILNGDGGGSQCLSAAYLVALDDIPSGSSPTCSAPLLRYSYPFGRNFLEERSYVQRQTA
ncbi:hypothetical protein F4811DRAFT_439264 [Daldinia bambusicola]|nr:hypothetical protein F4811DRAFT_439264 [Daldinia bambusicola]